MFQLLDFKKALLELGIQDSSVIHAIVSFDDLKKYNYYADEYVDVLLDVLADGATLVMNCFTWKFCRDGSFDIQKALRVFGKFSGNSRAYGCCLEKIGF